MIRNFWNIAWRNLMRNKVYSFINISGLSLGLACAMLIILYTKDESSFDRFHTNGDHIYRIVGLHYDKEGNKLPGGGNTGYYHGPVFERNIPEIAQVVRFQGGTMDIKKGTEVIREEVRNVDSNFFDVFRFSIIQGSPLNVLKDPNSIVVSEDIARKYFGTTDVLGRTLEMKREDAFSAYTISAVTKKCPQNSSIRFDILVPIAANEDYLSDKMNWFNYFLNTFVLLSPGAIESRVEAKMKQVYERDAKEAIEELKTRYDEQGSFGFELQPLKELHLGIDYGVGNGLSNGSNPWYSYVLSGIALFILLIACINFINLTIARSIKRSREIGIRKVVGSSRNQLMAQFIGESFFFTLFAFVLAVGIVELVLPTFNSLANKELSFSYLLDFQLVAVYAGLLLVTAFLAGFYPAIILSGFQPVKTLYGRFIPAGKNYLQQGLVVLQFSLATLLVIGTVTIYRQFNFMLSQPLGYDDKDLVKIEKWMLRPAEYERFRSALMRNNLIAGVAPSNDGYWSTAAKVNGEQQIQFAIESVDDQYLSILDLKIVAGRNFRSDMPADSIRHVLVNESFAKEAGWKNPLGKEVNFYYDNNRKYEVIGVIEDYHFTDMKEKIMPQLFKWNAENFGEVYIKVRKEEGRKALDHISASFKEIFPDIPFAYTFLEDDNRAAYEAEEKWKQMMLFGAVITIFISCIGLFGLSVLSAEKRTKEVGVRKVLGASVFNIASRLSVDFMKLVFISFFIAVPLAWYAAFKWLENYPYRISPGLSIFMFAAGLVLLVALVTISFQSIKAAMANPVKSLRTE